MSYSPNHNEAFNLPEHLIPLALMSSTLAHRSGSAKSHGAAMGHSSLESGPADLPSHYKPSGYDGIVHDPYSGARFDHNSYENVANSQPFGYAPSDSHRSSALSLTHDPVPRHPTLPNDGTPTLANFPRMHPPDHHQGHPSVHNQQKGHPGISPQSRRDHPEFHDQLHGPHSQPIHYATQLPQNLPYPNQLPLLAQKLPDNSRQGYSADYLPQQFDDSRQDPRQYPKQPQYYQGGPHAPAHQNDGHYPVHRKPPILPILENRRVVTSPSVAAYNADTTQNQQFRKDRDGKDNRAKSMTSSNQPVYYNNPQNQRSSSGSSGHTFSFSSKSRSLSSLGKLSSLSAKKFSSTSTLQKDRTVSLSTIATQKSSSHALKKPNVYPAILSRVAKAFKEGMVLTINMKDGLEYHDSFTGNVAIDLICDIIRTNDRNLALLLGRALDAQKFFHDATYNHRLRDSANEIYNFSRVYSDVEFFDDNGGVSGNGSNNNSNRASLFENQSSSSTPYPSSNYPPMPGSPIEGVSGSYTSLHKVGTDKDFMEQSRVNGVFTILTECYSPTCNRNRLCYSIACPRRLEQQARLNMKPRGGLRRAVSRLSLHDTESSKTLWHETVDSAVLEKLDKHEKMRQELIYELIYTERDYVKDLEFMTDFYIMPLRNPTNNIIPERERDAFIRTVFGGVNELLRLAKSLSEALTARQQAQKPVVETIGDVLLLYVGSFEPFIKYSGNKVFASFEHERQQQVNVKYARFLEAIEKKPESRKQDFSSFLIKGVQRPARYQLLVSGILKNTKEDSPDYKVLQQTKEELEKVLARINVQTGEATDRHKVMVLHRLLGRQTLEERFNFKLNYNNRIIYQVTLSRKRDNEKIDLYLFEHALLLVKHKIQNKREVHKVFERPIYLPLLFMNSGYEIPTFKTLLPFRENGSIVSDVTLRNKVENSQYNPVLSSQPKLQVNFLGLGSNSTHISLFADDLTNQNQVLLQVQAQQKKLIEKHDVFSLCKYETRRFIGNNRINCAVPCYGGKKLLYGTDAGVWVSTVRSISVSSSEKICSDPTLVISKPYVTQLEVLVEYSKVLVLSDKTFYEFDLSCTDSLDHVKNTRSGKVILNHISFFKTGVCDGKLLMCAVKSGNAKAINIVEPINPFDSRNKNKNRKPEVREITFTSDPVSISFLKTKLCIGCTKGFEILSLEAGKKESILDEADPSLDFATQRESVKPLAIHRLDKKFLLSYSEFSFFINGNGWRTKHDWGIFWEGMPQNIALFYPYLLAFDPGFIEIRDLETTTLIRALVGENIRFLHSNEHEAMYACEENGYDIIVSIDFLNLKPKPKA